MEGFCDQEEGGEGENDFLMIVARKSGGHWSVFFFTVWVDV